MYPHLTASDICNKNIANTKEKQLNVPTFNFHSHFLCKTYPCLLSLDVTMCAEAVKM